MEKITTLDPSTLCIQWLCPTHEHFLLSPLPKYQYQNQVDSVQCDEMKYMELRLVPKKPKGLWDLQAHQSSNQLIHGVLECGSLCEIEANIDLMIQSKDLSLPNTSLANSDQNLLIMELHRNTTTQHVPHIQLHHKSKSDKNLKLGIGIVNHNGKGQCLHLKLSACGICNCFRLLINMHSNIEQPTL